MRKWVLQNEFLKLSDGNEISDCSPDDIYRSVIECESVWSDLPVGKSGEAAQIEFCPYPVLIVSVVTDAPDGGLPSITLEIETQDGKRYPVSSKILETGHVVVDGTWYPVSAETIEETRNLFRETGVDECLRVGTLKSLLSLKSRSATEGPVTDRTSTGTEATARLARQPDAAPANVKATLYPYQKDGWQWLSFVVREQLGGLLADEMGLGKTLQVISVIADPGQGRSLTNVLVVAPGSLLENWVREIAKFSPGLKVLKHHGAFRTGRPAELKPFDVVVTSYDTVIRDLSLLKMIDWHAVILDEAQNIRNPEANRTQSVKRLPRKVGLAMTGTPVENRLTDLWSIMDFVVPDYLDELSLFRSTYEESVDSARSLEPLISPLMLRRTVEEVADDLPDRIDIPEVVELTDEEAAEYERTRQEIFDEYGRSASLVSLTSLRIFCAHPAILERTGEEFRSVAFSKFERLKEILAEIADNGDKAIVFTSYTDMADRIRAFVTQDLGLFSDTLDGRLPIDDRQPLIDSFTDVEGPAVLVLNPKAGGSGLNITAANHVIHYNLEWNPALEDQASARAHRRGQTRPVTVRRLFCAGTVEEVVNERVKRKRQVSGAAIVGVEGQERDYEDIVAALERSPVRRD